MSAQLYLFDPSITLRASGERLTPVETGIARPLRWAAWHPTEGWCLLVGNGGMALRYDPSTSLRAGPSTSLRAGGQRFETMETGSRHNLRGAAFSPDGRRALLVGNQGAVLLFDADARSGASVRALPSPTGENLRRVAWRPQGDFALIVGNGGTVLRYQDGLLTPVPADRAHTLRALAWRPDGAYALVGAYASRWAGYPRPHPLYKCDGLYLQALLASDQEDDFVAVDWHPSGREALIVGYAFDGVAAWNKLLTYDGAGFRYRAVEASGSLLGAAWRPQGDYALLVGERGALLRFDPSAPLRAGPSTALRAGPSTALRAGPSAPVRAGGERLEQLASATEDNLVGPFWRPDGSLALLLRGPGERVYTV